MKTDVKFFFFKYYIFGLAFRSGKKIVGSKIGQKVHVENVASKKNINTN